MRDSIKDTRISIAIKAIEKSGSTKFEILNIKETAKTAINNS
jgi:hypothetical protein